MAKYSPKTNEELRELVSDESVNLGDIDTSAITDMSWIFCDYEREDFSGIEKWDTSKVKNISTVFVGVYIYYVDISAICKQLKIKGAYIVKVDEDNQIQEVFEKYPDRLQAAWELKDRFENGDLDDDKEFFAVIGYEPNEIDAKNLEPLVGMDMEDADWLLQKCIRKAIAFDNTDGDSRGGTVGKIFGVYNNRLEIIELLENGTYPNEWLNEIEGDLQSLGYQQWFDVKAFVGRDWLFLLDALRWVEWLRWTPTYWWVEAVQDDGRIVRIVQKFREYHEAKEYQNELPQAKEGNMYVLITTSGGYFAFA